MFWTVVRVLLWVLTALLAVGVGVCGLTPAILALQQSPDAVSPSTLATLSTLVAPSVILFAVVFGIAADGFGNRPRVYLPSVLSAVLMWTAYFPLNWWGVAFVAMAPFLVLVRAEGIGRWRRYSAAWAGGLTFGALSANWLRHADPSMALFAWPGVALFLSFFWPIALFLVRRLDRLGRPPLALTFPVVWVGLEYVKAHFPTGYPLLKAVGLYYPSGFPWYFLGHTQHANIPLLQAADLGGVYLISAAVGAANGAVHDVLVRIPPVRWVLNLPRGWRLPVYRSELMAVAGALLVVGVLMVYGSVRLSHPPFEPGPRVALLQDNIPQKLLMQDGALVFSRYDRMTRQAVQASPPPDLVVWPEACYMYRDITFTTASTPAERERMISELPDDWPHTSSLAVQETTEKRPLFDLDRLNADARDDSVRRREEEAKQPPGERQSLDASGYWDLLRSGRRDHARTRWQRDPANPQTSVLIGSEAVDWDGKTEKRYNSARLLLPDGTPGPRYDKTHLVPFGEYIPFRDQFPILSQLTPSPNAPMCQPGQSFTRFKLASARTGAQGKVEAKTYTFGVLICYEDTDPTIARRYNPWSGESDPAHFLVNLSLDSWFGTSEELDQHLAISRFRAVEARRPLLRSVNLGISAAIDGDGRIIELPGLLDDGFAGSKNVASVVRVEVPLDSRGSPYAAVGDWVPVLCWAGIAAGLVTLRVARRKKLAPVPPETAPAG